MEWRWFLDQISLFRGRVPLRSDVEALWDYLDWDEEESEGDRPSVPAILDNYLTFDEEGEIRSIDEDRLPKFRVYAIMMAEQPGEEPTLAPTHFVHNHWAVIGKGRQYSTPAQAAAHFYNGIGVPENGTDIVHRYVISGDSDLATMGVGFRVPMRTETAWDRWNAVVRDGGGPIQARLHRTHEGRINGGAGNIRALFTRRAVEQFQRELHEIVESPLPDEPGDTQPSVEYTPSPNINFTAPLTDFLTDQARLVDQARSDDYTARPARPARNPYWRGGDS